MSHRADDDEDDLIAEEPSSSEDEDDDNDAAASDEEATEDDAVEDDEDRGGNVASTAAGAGSTLRANAAVAQQAANGVGTGSNKQRKLTISLSSKNDVCKVRLTLAGTHGNVGTKVQGTAAAEPVPLRIIATCLPAMSPSLTTRGALDHCALLPSPFLAHCSRQPCPLKSRCGTYPCWGSHMAT